MVCLAGSQIRPERVADAFVDACKTALLQSHGPDPKASPDFSRIAIERDVDRLATMVEGKCIVVGGTDDRPSRYFASTIACPVDIRLLVTSELLDSGATMANTALIR